MGEDLSAANGRSERPFDIATHRQIYIQSGGTDGHIVSLETFGGRPFTTTLLLRTVGRKTGQARILPLIYGRSGGEVVVVASKGGADAHPAWYLNLLGGGEAAFQIATQAFRASWREAQAGERDRIWALMDDLYPPYAQYRAATERDIPLVLLTAHEAIEVFRE